MKHFAWPFFCQAQSLKLRGELEILNIIFFFIRTISSYIARWKVSYLGRKLVKWEPNKRGSSWCDAFRLFFALLVPSGWICLPLVLFGLFIYKYIFAVFPKVLCFFVIFFCWVQWFYMSGQHHSEFCISKTVL